MREKHLALVVHPTYAGKNYALDEWVDAYNALTYEPRTTFIVDNTAVSKAYLATLQAKGLNAVHLQPWLDKPWEYTAHRCWELILEEAQRLDAFWIYSVEADNIPAPESLQKMVDLAEYGSIHLVTHDYPLHQSAAEASGMVGNEYRYCEFGCMLMSRQLLERALKHYDEYGAMALAVFETNWRYLGGHCRLMHSFEVKHLDGFETEYPQGFAEPPPDSRAITPTPFVPDNSFTKLPPSLEGTCQIVKERRHVKLNLGSGGTRIPGYTSVDFDEDLKPDVVSDVESLPFDDETVDEIFASHVLEHLPLESDALSEWKRVLIPGGLLTVAVPDVLKVYTLSKSGGEWSIDGRPMDERYINASVFGGNLLGYGNPELQALYGGPGHQHRQIFILDMLVSRLRAAGFEEVRQVPGCEVRGAGLDETMAQGRKPQLQLYAVGSIELIKGA